MWSCSGCFALAQRRLTRSAESSPESVVRSMQAMARSSHAACQSFFTVRRVVMVAVRRSTALVLTRISSTQSRLSGMRRLGSSARPFSSTGTACGVAEGRVCCRLLMIDCHGLLQGHRSDACRKAAAETDGIESLYLSGRDCERGIELKGVSSEALRWNDPSGVAGAGARGGWCSGLDPYRAAAGRGRGYLVADFSAAGFFRAGLCLYISVILCVLQTWFASASASELVAGSKVTVIKHAVQIDSDSSDFLGMKARICEIMHSGEIQV